MPRFRVYPTMTVSTCVEVEAEDAESAVEAALEGGIPSLMFLDHTYPDEGDWDADVNDVEQIGG